MNRHHVPKKASKSIYHNTAKKVKAVNINGTKGKGDVRL